MKWNEGVEKESGKTPSVKTLIKESITESRITWAIFLDNLSFSFICPLIHHK